MSIKNTMKSFLGSRTRPMPVTGDYRAHVGSCLEDRTPSRAGRLLTNIPGTSAVIAIPRALVRLCNFQFPSDAQLLPAMHLVYFACAITNVNTYAWIRHALDQAEKFDTISIVFQCRGVISKEEAEQEITNIVASTSLSKVEIFVYDDPPIRPGPDIIDNPRCRVPISDCLCHDNYGGEYRGLSMAHEIAAKCRDSDVVTYWHSKGVSRYVSLEQYLEAEAQGPTELMMGFPFIREMFASLPNLALWSCFVGERHQPIPWYNFWSTRAGRLKSLPPPQKTGQRHYYETYLGDIPLKPHEITISPSPMNNNGYLQYILEVGYEVRRPRWWHYR